MPLLSLRSLHLAFGGPSLLDDAQLSIEPGERIALVGRNGEGKSTLLKIVAGLQEPDSGDVIRKNGLRVSFLPQEVPGDLDGTVLSVVLAGLRADASLAALSAISRMGLDADADATQLSGGQKRKVLLARALAQEPDLLVLDEPTNHLDIPSIALLEQVLVRMENAVLFVTHDRAFLRRLATRILELDRGRLSSWECGWDKFLERRDARLQDEERANALFDKRLAEEETWIRKGIQARRTRNEGRVRALLRMREERMDRRDRSGTVRMEVAEAERSGRVVARVKDLSFRWPDKWIVEGLSTEVSRGDRVGIVGPNGSGKTTLLRLILGLLVPVSGEVRMGTNLQIAYFDQLRAELKMDQTLIDNIGDGKEWVDLPGGRKHVLSYLQDFLFRADRARGPISALSGGERNRLLLARLFSKPSNLLVLDEPTNDLDVETLDLLEERLAEYQGTVLVTSHDREFLDRVCTSLLVMESPGLVREVVGGYSDWIRLGGSLEAWGKPGVESSRRAAKKVDAPETGSNAVPANPSGPRKLSYKEKREFDALPERIETLERSVAELQEMLGRPEVYTDHQRLLQVQSDLARQEDELLVAWTRYGELGG